MSALLLMALLGSAGAAPLPDVRRPLAEGAWVNWTELAIEVEARASEGSLGGATRANEEAARGEITDRIGAVTQLVQVRGDLTMVAVASQAGRRAEAGWRAAEGRYHAGGTVEVVGRVPLPSLLGDWSRERSAPPPAELGVEAPHTGLVIDARAFVTDPVFAPRIVGPGGEVLFDSILWADHAGSTAPAVWVADPAHVAAARAGSSPLFLLASGVRPGVLVLDTAGAAALKVAFDGQRALGEGRVVVVVAP